jgi:hypothetical protein
MQLIISVGQTPRPLLGYADLEFPGSANPASVDRSGISHGPIKALMLLSNAGAVGSYTATFVCVDVLGGEVDPPTAKLVHDE